MTFDDKAGRLVDYLQIILLELKGNDKKNPAEGASQAEKKPAE